MTMTPTVLARFWALRLVTVLAFASGVAGTFALATFHHPLRLADPQILRVIVDRDVMRMHQNAAQA